MLEQIAAELTDTAELTDCSWSDKKQGRAAKQVTLSSSAD